MAEKKPIYTPVFTVSYPQVFTAKKNDLSGEDEYSVVALFKLGENLDVLKAAALEAVKKKWGEKESDWPNNLRKAFRDQIELATKKNDKGELIMPPGTTKGALFIRLKSKQKPGVLNAQAKPILDESEFYAGCKAIATVTCYAYDQKGNKGYAFGLSNLQKVGEGDRLSSRPKAEEEFAPIEGVAGEADGGPITAASIF